MPLLCAYLFLDAKLLIICITAKFFDAKCAACRFCLMSLRGRFCVAGRCWGALLCRFVAAVFCLRCCVVLWLACFGCVVVSLCSCRVLPALLCRFVAGVFKSRRCFVAVVFVSRCCASFVAGVWAVVLFPYKYIVPLVILELLFSLFPPVFSLFPLFISLPLLIIKNPDHSCYIASSGRAVPQ